MPTIVDMRVEKLPMGDWEPIPKGQFRHHIHGFWRKGHLDIWEVEGVRYFSPEEYRRVCRELNVASIPPSRELLTFTQLADHLNVSKTRLYRMGRKKMFPVFLRSANGLVQHARIADVKRALLLHWPEGLLVVESAGIVLQA